MADITNPGTPGFVVFAGTAAAYYVRVMRCGSALLSKPWRRAGARHPEAVLAEDREFCRRIINVLRSRYALWVYVTFKTLASSRCSTPRGCAG